MKTVQKQTSRSQQPNKYILKNFERDAQVILVGLGCLFILQVVTSILPLYIMYYLHVPLFPPFLTPGHYGVNSVYVWIGYLISGIIVGRIAKNVPVMFAIGVGVIFAILYISFLEHLLPPSDYLYKVFAAQVFFALIIFTGIGGLIGQGLQKNK
ncbi:MAG TPA: hypothetical protein VLF89_04165 [Candidatus Saccharimonadales bacterium]|nr:hypothetical protein [Candidatus Saccharimonadales bacterium]